jgi:hypothetical protein
LWHVCFIACMLSRAGQTVPIEWQGLVHRTPQSPVTSCTKYLCPLALL